MVASFSSTDTDDSGSSRCAKYYGALSGRGGASTGVIADDGRHPVVMRQMRPMRVLMVLVVAGAGLLAARARTTTTTTAPALLRAGGADGGSDVSRIGVPEDSETRGTVSEDKKTLSAPGRYTDGAVQQNITPQQQ